MDYNLKQVSEMLGISVESLEKTHSSLVARIEKVERYALHHFEQHDSFALSHEVLALILVGWEQDQIKKVVGK